MKVVFAIGLVIAALIACDRDAASVRTARNNGAQTTSEQYAPDVPFGDEAHRREIHDTLGRIATRGPYPYRQDGEVFANREQRLPLREYGYYHEFTVRTPGLSTRGARRIIRGDAAETFYTDDHYRSFVVIDPSRY